MFRSITLLSVILFVAACTAKHEATSIIEQAIEAHGGDAYENKRIEFDFRQFYMVLEQKGGQFRYERTHQDSSRALIREVLTNNGLSRFINGQLQTLDTAQI